MMDRKTISAKCVCGHNGGDHRLDYLKNDGAGGSDVHGHCTAGRCGCSGFKAK